MFTIRGFTKSILIHLYNLLQIPPQNNTMVLYVQIEKAIHNVFFKKSHDII